jgi:hypothetical protein
MRFNRDEVSPTLKIVKTMYHIKIMGAVGVSAEALAGERSSGLV